MVGVHSKVGGAFSTSELSMLGTLVVSRIFRTFLWRCSRSDSIDGLLEQGFHVYSLSIYPTVVIVDVESRHRDRLVADQSKDALSR